MTNPIRDIGVLPADLTVESATAASTRAVRPDAQTASAERAAQPLSDSTRLTPLGGLLGPARQTAGSIESFRPDVVASVKQQVASGTYRPDPNLVAQRVAAALNAVKP